MTDIAFAFIHKAKIIIGDISVLHIQRSHRLIGRHKIDDTIPVLIVVGAIAQEQQILDSAAWRAVEIEHTTKVADGSNVFGTT